jgi:hypothetical protein
MVGKLLPDSFDTKIVDDKGKEIVDDKGKEKGADLVGPEAMCVAFGMVAIFG